MTESVANAVFLRSRTGKEEGEPISPKGEVTEEGTFGSNASVSGLPV